MIDLPQLKARVTRLEKLVNGLAAELAVWQKHPSPLKQGEYVWYLNHIKSAHAAGAVAQGGAGFARRDLEGDGVAHGVRLVGHGGQGHLSSPSPGRATRNGRLHADSR